METVRAGRNWMSGTDSETPPSSRVALVTGGSNGIGAAVVRALAARGGWHIVVADIDETAGSAIAAEVGGLFVRTDVADPTASAAAVQAGTEIDEPLRFFDQRGQQVGRQCVDGE